MKKILFAASEGVPFIKTGGLADVVGSLPECIDRKYFDVRVILPKYACMRQEMKDKMEYVTHFYMDYNWKNEYVGILKAEAEGITYYFIDSEYYFSGFKPYGDNVLFEIEKFAYFSKAVLSALKLIDFQPNVIHCHDWQTGLIPVYLKERFGGDLFYHDIKTVMTIHNLKFQGRWDVKAVQSMTGLSDYFFTSDKLESYKDANLLKGGLVYADYITTVSATYCDEIQTPYYGEGLDGLLRARHYDMQGIVNGIDNDVYDPSKDSKIYKNFDVSTFRKNKKVNKAKLQADLGLEVDPKKYMIGLISRLTDQKGLDLINYCIEGIVDDFTQLVVIGTGESKYENMFRHYAWKYPEKISANICYDDNLAHKLYAAADAFLMPSRFEPCGLTQLISFRYGTVPIVRETGGLSDTVEAFDEYKKTGDGFSFANYNGDELLNTVNYSKFVFFDKKTQWNKMVERGMNKNYSWAVQKEKYENIYNYLIG